MFHKLVRLTVFTLLLGSAETVLAQPAPATAPATTQPDDAALPAVVQQVQGKVFYEAPGQAGTWQPVKVGDRLMPGTRIRTMFRSSVIFTLSDTTVVKVDKVTVMRINDARRTAEAERVRIGLEYGEVRAGVAEREIRSDFTIDSPNATLARRGTHDFGIYSERMTRRFTVSLAGDGLVQALNHLSNQYRTVYARQQVTEAMVRWINQAKFDWFVSIQPTEGMTSLEQSVAANQGGSGRGVLDPGASIQINTVVDGNAGLNLQTALEDAGLPFEMTVPGRLFNQAGSFGLGGATPLDGLVKDQPLLRGRRGFFAPRNRLVTRLHPDGGARSFRSRHIGQPRVGLR
jgi:hypothetical protein